MKRSKIWMSLLVISLALILLWQGGARRLTGEITYPATNAYGWFKRSIGARARAVFVRTSYAARNATLERDLERLRMLTHEVDRLEAEVMRLNALLEFKPPVPRSWLAAPILSRGGTLGLWQSIRVGKGSLHGVSQGDPVVVADGLVGRVTGVTPHSAEIMLISDPNSRVACELETGEVEGVAARGILYGGGTSPTGDPELTLLYLVDPLRLRYLARDFEPAPRTRVITSGLGPAFPRGIVVGYLLESRLDANGLSREALIMPAVDICGMHEVFIISGGSK